METCYESCSCSLLVYVLWISLILHGFIYLRCCEWIGYRIDIIFLQWELLGIYVSGIALEACNCRLQIEYVDDVRFIWYTFGGMDSWMGLALVMGVISAMDIFTTTNTYDYLGKITKLCHLLG